MNPAVEYLQGKARSMILMAHRPSTAKTYATQFKVLLALASYLEVEDIQDIGFLKSFVTYLYDNGLSSRTISSYLSSIKFYFTYYNLNFKVLEHPALTLLLRSFVINAPVRIRKQGIITIQLLSDIVQACDILQYPTLYKALFLLAFFSFCRISNFAATSVANFQITNQFVRNDIIWGAPGAHLIIKWAKNIQDRKSHQVVRIPLLKNKLLCPVLALQTYFKAYPASSHAPMFFNPSTRLPVIQSSIRNSLAMVLSKLGIPQGFITFHSFRRSGATFAFNHHVPLESIQAHGCWKSSAVWAYLQQARAAGNQVACAFSSNIH